MTSREKAQKPQKEREDSFQTSVEPPASAFSHTFTRWPFFIAIAFSGILRFLRFFAAFD